MSSSGRCVPKAYLIGIPHRWDRPHPKPPSHRSRIRSVPLAPVDALLPWLCRFGGSTSAQSRISQFARKFYLHFKSKPRPPMSRYARPSDHNTRQVCWASLHRHASGLLCESRVYFHRIWCLWGLQRILKEIRRSSSWLSESYLSYFKGIWHFF